MTEDVSVLVHSRIQCYVTDNANPHTLLVDGNQRLDVLDRRVLRGAVTHASVRLAGSLSPASQRAITNNRSLRRLR